MCEEALTLCSDVASQVEAIKRHAKKVDVDVTSASIGT